MLTITKKASRILPLFMLFAQGSANAGAQTVTMQSLVYGESILYAAAGVQYIPHCNSAAVAAENAARSQCAQMGYDGDAKQIGDAVEVDSGLLSYSNPEHLPQLEQGHRYYCKMEVTVMCRTAAEDPDFESPMCFLKKTGHGGRWGLYRWVSKKSIPQLVKEFSMFNDYQDARRYSDKNAAEFGCKFTDQVTQLAH